MTKLPDAKLYIDGKLRDAEGGVRGGEDPAS